MKRGMQAAIDAYVVDMWSQGRMRSPRTERSYRGCLYVHADDVGNRDPHDTNRQDVKTTLSRWQHPNTQATMRAILVSFYDWAMEEGRRKDNPARQVRRPKRIEPQVYRMTRDEVARLLASVQGPRERRAIFVGVCAGLRRAELLGLQGRHFQRPGFVWVSADIAKRGWERFVPVTADLEPVVADILERVDTAEYVLPAQRWRDPGVNREQRDYNLKPSSEQALWRLVRTVGARAGIAHPLRPHMLRHAFADHIARYAGMRNAQFLLGHRNIGTTEAYLGEPTLDELVDSVVGFSFGAPQGSPPLRGAVSPVDGLSGSLPVPASSRTAERLSVVLRHLYASPVLREAAR